MKFWELMFLRKVGKKVSGIHFGKIKTRKLQGILALPGVPKKTLHVFKSLFFGVM